MESSSSRAPEVTRRQAGKGPAWLPCNRAFECVLSMVRDRLGGHAARGKGASRRNGNACMLVPRRGVNCEHMQASVTNIFQRHWGWQGDRRTDLQPGLYRYNSAFMASLDVKTAFDVAKPSVAWRIFTLTGVHGHLTAALLAEMEDVRGFACFENSETEFRYSRCIRQGGVEAPVRFSSG